MPLDCTLTHLPTPAHVLFTAAASQCMPSSVGYGRQRLPRSRHLPKYRTLLLEENGQKLALPTIPNDIEIKIKIKI